MPRIPRVTEHLRVGIVERTDARGHLHLVADPSVVVLPDSAAPRSRAPWCPRGCRWPMICASCADEVRSEAFRWLSALADDHFGYNIEHLIAVAGPTPDVRVLWRDPLGVARIYGDSNHSSQD